MKKTISIILIILLTIIALCGHVNAGTVRIETSNSDITNGQTVSVTISFGKKVSAAQFTLSYDTSRFEYISCSAGKFGTKTNTFVYLNLEDERDLESVVLTFKSKNLGTGTFNVSDVILSTENVSMVNETINITIKEKETNSGNNGSGTNSGNNGSGNNSGNNGSGTNSGNNGSGNNSGNNGSGNNSGNSGSSNNSGSSGSSNNSGSTSLVIESNNSNKNNISTSNTGTIVEENVEKPELEAVKTALVRKVETDYTEESWKELQEAIALAETANTNAKYNEIKGLLTTDNLVKATFEKTELNQILIDLIGKSSKDYTAESWNKLLETIKLASNAELKSEYEAIKDKLTINSLVIEEQKDSEEIAKNSFENTTLIISLAVIALIVLIIIIVFKKLRSK